MWFEQRTPRWFEYRAARRWTNAVVMGWVDPGDCSVCDGATPYPVWATPMCEPGSVSSHRERFDVRDGFLGAPPDEHRRPKLPVVGDLLVANLDDERLDWGVGSTRG